jgi:hypothetical protein
MGLIIGGALVSIVLADLVAFYALSAVFAYSYEMAWQVAYGFFYVLLAWILFSTNDRIASYRRAWLGRLHGLVSKSLWCGLWTVLLACVLLNITGNFTAHSSTRYVEVSGTWVWQSTKSYFMGSDFYSKPVPQRSPVLRDIESDETFYVIDQTDQAFGYTLIANRGIDRKAGARQGSCRSSHAAFCGVCGALVVVLTTASRSGLSATTLMWDQSRVLPDQRAGLRRLAWQYSAWRAARMA